ncbi:MAG TPA: phosphopantetheine-binding protein [Chloroflexota bacterium]
MAENQVGPEPRARDLELALRDTWSRVIGHEIEVDDDIFDLDVDSLKLVELCAELDRTGVEVSLETLLDLGTVARLADHLATGAQARSR